MRRRLTPAYMREPKLSRDGRVSLHEAAIRGLVDSHPDMRRNGFQHSIRQLWLDLYGHMDEEDREEVPTIPAVPDAFRLDRENSDILIYEVEDTNPISQVKLRAYAYYWYEWDSDGAHEWLPRLFIVDRYGNVSIEVDLMAMYHCLIGEDAGVAKFPQTPIRIPTPESEIARLGGEA